LYLLVAVGVSVVSRGCIVSSHLSLQDLIIAEEGEGIEVLY